MFWIPFWPKRKEEEKAQKGKAFKRIIVGFIIGSAITSIIGKKLHEKDEEEGE